MTSLSSFQETLEKAVHNAFRRHAIDNNGTLTSAHRGSTVAREVCQLALKFIAGKAGEPEIMTVTTQLAEQGLAMVTAKAMMEALGQATWDTAADSSRLMEFQLLFLEKLANNREYAHRKTQERSQLALQQALHKQLEQQRRLHHAQELRNRNLNEVLQLNARLIALTEEEALLSASADGICQALNLANVTIYEQQQAPHEWIVRTTTMDDQSPGQLAVAQTADLLNTATANNGEFINRDPAEKRKELVTIAIILRLGKGKLGGMIANSGSLNDYSYEEFPILIRTFAQNLTALWRNLLLFTETQQRAHELEIMHGRYLDTIWNNDTTTLQAQFKDNVIRIQRSTQLPASLPPDSRGTAIHVGGRLFGQIKLPQNVQHDSSVDESAQALIREMSNALNNAHLLQTARSFSNQLSLAAEVSRAATTILERDQLMQEVVELIRARFNYYYVGLFLMDDDGKTIVLRAGTGEAGRLQIEQGHTLLLDGNSMVSAAINTGKPRVEQDVSQAKAFHRNILLPETRAEIAVPLHSRDIVTGAFTIQSNKTGVFTQETVSVLQTLADQLAVAMMNASLFERLQGNLDEKNFLYNASHHINAAKTDVDVYQALINFSRDSNLADAAYVICVDPSAPDFFIMPVLWSRIPNPRYQAQNRFPRDRFPFDDGLTTDKLLLIRDSQTDRSLSRFARRLARENNLRSLALIPIQIEGEQLATLALQRAEANAFTESELQPFLTLVDQTAVILSNQQLLKQAETLYQVGQSLSQALTLDDALEIAVNKIAQYTGASQCRLVIYDKQTQAGHIVAEYAPSGLAKTVQFPMSDDFVFTNLSHNLKPLLLNEQMAAPDTCLQQYVHQFKANASLLIPAISQQELMGFLAIDSPLEERPFNQANIIFAQTVVDHLTTQIENLRLLEETLKRAQDLITLNQIQSGISSILDLDGLAQTVYNQVGNLLDSSLFILARFHADSSQFIPILTMRDGQKVHSAIQLIMEGEPIHNLLFNPRTLTTDQNDPIMHPSLIPGLQDTPRSALWVPLWHDNQPTGLISLQSYEPHRYSETHGQLLRSIATHTSLAMANAQLFEEIQASNKQLRQLDHLKTQFLASMSHELRTPLNSIIGFSRVILKGIDGPLSAAQEEDLKIINDNGQLLLALINEILDMAKIEAGKMTVSFEQIDPSEAAHAALDAIRGLIDERNVQLITDIAPHLPHIDADPLRLRQILNNLLSNAAKFTNEGHIRFLMEQEDDALHITVEDTGIGIHKEDHEALFTPFEQVENRNSRIVGGTGLGLPITRWLVDMHNGRIWVNSQPGQGSSFHILLPINQAANSPAEVTVDTAPLSPDNSLQP